MASSPFPDATIQNRDFWILGVCRDASAITLFIVAPALQFILFRWLPFAILLSLTLLFLGHAMTGWRYFSPAVMSIFTNPRTWPRTQQLLAAFYAAFLGWATLSLLWTPLPIQGMENILVLALAPPIVLILAHEFARAIAIPFPIILCIGLILILIFLSAELASFTMLHRLVDTKGALYDLNRNNVLLALLLLPLLLWVKKTPSGLIAGTALVLAVLTVSSYSLSQSAQLMLVFGLATWMLVRFCQILYRFLFAGMALTILIFPLMLDPLESSVSGLQYRFFTESSATARIQIWKKYRIAIAKKPIVGWGVRANRQLGSNGISQTDAEKKFGLLHPHPHNVAIEFWTDYGLIGILLVMCIIISFGEATRHLAVNKRSIVAAIAIAGFTYSMTGSAFFQGWWISSMAMVAIALVATQRTLSGKLPISPHPWKRKLQKF